MDDAERMGFPAGVRAIAGASAAQQWPRAVAATSDSVPALEERIRELEQALRCRDEFLAILAHELRNPLAPIRNVAQILAGYSHSEPTLKTASEILVRQSTHMSRLVDDLFDTARGTWGCLALDMKLVDAAAILATALETIRPRLAGALHRVSVDVPAEPLPVRADETRLAQIFCNLLENAVKFTPEGGMIEVEALADAGQAVVRIRDDGLGIPENMLGSIFELFKQARPDRDPTRGGLGLGLPLVKRLVEMHGGRVEAKSDGPDRGSEFVVTIPLAITTAPARLVVSDAPGPALHDAIGVRGSTTQCVRGEARSKRGGVRRTGE